MIKYSGVLEKTGDYQDDIKVIATVTEMHDPAGFAYTESVGDLSTTYTASSLEELLGNVDHMLLARVVVKQAMTAKA